MITCWEQGFRAAAVHLARLLAIGHVITLAYILFIVYAMEISFSHEIQKCISAFAQQGHK
jgi:hypothetical protein